MTKRKEYDTVVVRIEARGERCGECQYDSYEWLSEYGDYRDLCTLFQCERPDSGRRCRECLDASVEVVE